MPYVEVSTNATDIKKTPGKEYEGTYRSHKEITTKIGPQIIWEFTSEDGAGFGIYGFTNLNRAMERVTVGQVCKIVYRGTEKVQTKYGMKDVHQVSVQLWQEDGEPHDSTFP
jgi:hypothetical protein